MVSMEPCFSRWGFSVLWVKMSCTSRSGIIDSFFVFPPCPYLTHTKKIFISVPNTSEIPGSRIRSLDGRHVVMKFKKGIFMSSRLTVYLCRSIYY